MANEVFLVNPQPVGDSIDVIEVRHDLNGVVDGRVIKPFVSESPNALFRDRSRTPREMLGKFTERPIRRVQIGGLPVRGDRVDKRVTIIGRFELPSVVNLGTELLCMGANSVDTFVDHGHDNRQHLALSA